MVELAFSLGLLAVIVVGTVDFGRVFYLSMELNAAARAGAQFAAKDLANSTKTDGTIESAAVAAYLYGSTDSRFTLSTSDVILGESGTTGQSTAQVPKCAAADGSGTFDDPAGSPKTCSSACTVGKPVKVCYVKVTVTKNFSRRSGFPIPGLPNPLSVSRSVWQRVQ